MFYSCAGKLGEQGFISTECTLKFAHYNAFHCETRHLFEYLMRAYSALWRVTIF